MITERILIIIQAMKQAGEKKEVSLVIPAYNEGNVIEESVEETLNELDKISTNYEVIISDNGSTDSLPEIAEQLANTYPEVRWVQEPQPGRGVAVEAGFDIASGDVLAFIDADLATDMQHLEELIESVRSENYDLATGSRWMPGHEAERPVQRTVASKGFNFLARVLLGSSLRDHQCGFKAFSTNVVENVIPEIKANHWFWDTEILVLAANHSYNIKEFPVKWKPQDESEVELHKDIPQMFFKIIELMFRLRTQRDLSNQMSYSQTE